MKNITFRAEESLIERARLVAQDIERSLPGMAGGYGARAGSGAAVDDLMRRLQHIRSSGPYGRDEMVER